MPTTVTTCVSDSQLWYANMLLGHSSPQSALSHLSESYLQNIASVIKLTLSYFLLAWLVKERFLAYFTFPQYGWRCFASQKRHFLRSLFRFNSIQCEVDIAAYIPIYKRGSAGTLTIGVESELIVIISTATYILPALCVHSNFPNPGNCCHRSKLLPGRNQEAEQKWHSLISYYELWLRMDRDLCQWTRQFILCQLLRCVQWSVLFVANRNDRDEKPNHTDIKQLTVNAFGLAD